MRAGTAAAAARPGEGIGAASARPGAAAIDDATYRVLLAALLGVALLLQAGLFAFGLYRVSSDEGARALIALELTWSNALAPSVWPPFTKVFVGAFLKLWGDPFLVPRILSSLAGLLAVASLVRLAELLFADRRVALLAGALAVVNPHRLIFAVAPMSDIYYYLFLIAAAVGVLGWLRGRGVARLLLGCLGLMLAETVRFEAGVFAGVLMLLVLHRVFLRRELGLGTAVVAAVLLFGFPAYWVLASAWHGELDNLGITSWQWVSAFGDSRLFALRLSPLGRNLALDLVWNPAMLLGLAAAVWAWRRDAQARPWMLVFGAPYLLVSAAMVLSLSIPMAAPWRTTGAWALLLLPFEAAALAWLWARLRGAAAAAMSSASPAWRWVPVAALAVALLGPAARSAVYVHEGTHDLATGGWREDRAAGLFIRDELARLGGGRALVDSLDRLEYLDVLVASTVPGRFVLSSGYDALDVALNRPAWERHRRQKAGDDRPVEEPPTDRYGLARGGAAEALAADDVRLVLARTPAYVAALDGSPLVERVRSFGTWVLYRVRPPA